MKLFLLLSLVLTTGVFGQTIKNARSTDVASKYELTTNGDLFRYIKGTNQKCQVTNDVDSFKISQHASDTAVIYYVRRGDLYILKNANLAGSCPKADKKVLVSNIKKYTIVSNTDTTIVNLALDEFGTLTAYDNTKEVFKISRVEEYLNNTCYGSEGKSFNSYVAFAITFGGQVVKVKGNAVDSSKTTSEIYSSIQEFKKQENICN